MPYRFFYIGPRQVILLLQDAFKRAKEAKLTSEQISCFDIVPEHPEHARLNKSRFAKLLRDLWRLKGDAVLFYDTGFEQEQREELLESLKKSDVKIYPLRRPRAEQEDCDRTAMMMLSTPLWTQAYVEQAFAKDDAFLEEYHRIVAENERLSAEIEKLKRPPEESQVSVPRVLADAKGKHHPHCLVITATAEKTAASCRYADSDVVREALEAIAEYVTLSIKTTNGKPDLEQHFNDRGYHFAPTNTAATKSDEGEHYVVLHDGERYETHMHLKRGSFRIYFCLTNDVAVIGAVGDHLPTAGYAG